MNPLAVIAIEAAKHARKVAPTAQKYPGIVTATSVAADGTQLATVLRNGASTAVTIPAFSAASATQTLQAGSQVMIEYRPSGAAYVIGVI